MLPTAAPCRNNTRRILWTVVLSALATLLGVQSAAAVPPSGLDFSIGWGFNPPLTRPIVGQGVTFTGTPTQWEGNPTTISWNFGDGSGATGPTVTHAFGASGTYEVKMVVTNNMGEASAEFGKFVSINAPPSAVFSFGPASPLPGQDVKFASESSDPDGQIARYDWAFGDGITSQDRSPSHPYGSAGPKTVTLTVTDAYGAQSTVSHQVLVQAPPTILNQLPLASFALSPRRPTVGQQIEFVSSATDPEGSLRDQRWDLDGDGQFDDAQGDRVLETYSTPGPKTVRLRVVDAGGAAAVAERVVTVSPGPTTRAGLLSPFPVVRISGEARAFGTLVRILSVRAPRATQVRVKCTGKGCPAKVRRRRVGKRRVVRFRAFERTLPAGVRLQVFARKRDKIGKYTSFRIRRNLAPKRVDRCLVPGRSRPVRCGSRETRVPIPSP